ncbi:MAG: zinc ribbon domain-containing protein, partial [Promethearchaeota archaeon]
GIHLFIGIMVVIRILSKRGFFHSRRNNIPKIDRNKPLQQTPQRAINGSKSCPNCGTLITKESSLFCTNCGQKL